MKIVASLYPLSILRIEKGKRTNCVKAGGKANVLFKVKQLTAATTLMCCIELHTHGNAYMYHVSFQPPGVLGDNDHNIMHAMTVMPAKSALP